MKSHFSGSCLCLCIAAIVVLSVPAAADWESIGPEGGRVKFVCVSPTDDNIVYLATETNPVCIWRSSDGGLTWNKKGKPYHMAQYFYCMTIGPADELYAGTWCTVYKSTDQGATWTGYPVVSGMMAMAVHPLNPSIVYGTGNAYRAGNYDFVFFKSTNGGTSWDTTEILPGPNNSGYAIGIDPNNPGTIFIGGHSQNVPKMYRSTNGGVGWAEVNITATGILFRSVKVHPTNSNIVYAGTQGNGFWRSTDGGGTWTRTSAFANNLCIATTAASPNLVFSTNKDSLMRSTDAGVNWVKYGIASGLGLGDYFSLAVSRTNANKVYTGCQSSFYRSLNMGSAWARSIGNLRAGEILDIGMAPGSPNRLFVEFPQMCLYETSNCGSTWNPRPYFPSVCGSMCAWQISPLNPDIRYAFEGEG